MIFFSSRRVLFQGPTLFFPIDPCLPALAQRHRARIASAIFMTSIEADSTRLLVFDRVPAPSEGQESHENSELSS